MAFTQHGHHIPGSPDTGEMPANVARCGGSSLCISCMRDCSTWYLQNSPTPVVKELFPKNEDHRPADILRYFESKHLPPALAAVSSSFEELAVEIDEYIPNGPEKSVALRKLLESKDAAVRASLDLV